MVATVGHYPTKMVLGSVKDRAAIWPVTMAMFQVIKVTNLSSNFAVSLR